MPGLLLPSDAGAPGSWDSDRVTPRSLLGHQPAASRSWGFSATVTAPAPSYNKSLLCISVYPVGSVLWRILTHRICCFLLAFGSPAIRQFPVLQWARCSTLPLGSNDQCPLSCWTTPEPTLLPGGLLGSPALCLAEVPAVMADLPPWRAVIHTATSHRDRSGPG